MDELRVRIQKNLKYFSTDEVKNDSGSLKPEFLRKSKPAEIENLKGDEYIKVRNNTPVNTLTNLKKRFPNGLKLALQLTKSVADKDGVMDEDFKKSVILLNCQNYTWETLSVDEYSLKNAHQSNLKFKKLKIRSTSYSDFIKNFDLILELLNKNKATLHKSNIDMLKNNLSSELDSQFKEKVNNFLEKNDNMRLDNIRINNVYEGVDQVNITVVNPLNSSPKHRVTKILSQRFKDEKQRLNEEQENSIILKNRDLELFNEEKQKLELSIKNILNMLNSNQLCQNKFKELETEIDVNKTSLKTLFKKLEDLKKLKVEQSDLDCVLMSYENGLKNIKDKVVKSDKLIREIKRSKIKAYFEAKDEYKNLEKEIENKLPKTKFDSTVSIESLKMYFEHYKNKIYSIDNLKRKLQDLMLKKIDKNPYYENEIRYFILNCDLIKKAEETIEKYSEYCKDYKSIFIEVKTNCSKNSRDTQHVA